MPDYNPDSSQSIQQDFYWLSLLPVCQTGEMDLGMTQRGLVLGDERSDLRSFSTYLDPREMFLIQSFPISNFTGPQSISSRDPKLNLSD